MAGYWIPGYGICSYQQYQAYVKGEFTMAGLNDVVNAMNNDEVKETKVMEGNATLNILDAIKAGNKVDNIIPEGATRLEGQGLVDLFGSFGEVAKLGVMNKAGTHATDGETFGVIVFKPVQGENYFTFVSGKVKEKIEAMINYAGSEYNLNKIIAEQGLKAMFGKKVVTSDDGQHTNVKIWFES